MAPTDQNFTVHANTGIERSGVYKCCTGNYQFSGGFMWRFAPDVFDEDDPDNHDWFQKQKEK